MTVPAQAVNSTTDFAREVVTGLTRWMEGIRLIRSSMHREQGHTRHGWLKHSSAVSSATPLLLTDSGTITIMKWMASRQTPRVPIPISWTLFVTVFNVDKIARIIGDSCLGKFQTTHMSHWRTHRDVFRSDNLSDLVIRLS
jgi:hypothetical protein